MIREVLTLERLRAMTPDEAAALWLVRGDDHPADIALFEAWLADREANEAAWARARRVWEDFEDGDDDEMLQAMRSSALALGPRPGQVRWARLAAGVAVAALSVGLLAGVLGHLPGGARRVATASDAGDPLGRFGDADFSTGKGQRSVADLPDGTRLALDTDSAVDVAYAGRRREVRLLRGQAFFEVAHDASRPFVVDARTLVVTALGTRFDARLDPGGAAITLVEGRVSIAKAGVPSRAAVELRAGERFTTSTAGPDSIAKVNVEDALAWQSGYVDFRNETLRAAAAELNRYSRTQIVIRDPRVAGLRISGRFRTGDVRRFCRAVALVQAVRAVQRGPDTIELVATGR